jgi:hypothetical protein
MRARTLLVEPNVSALATIQHAISGVTQVDVCTTFSEARGRLRCHEYSRLVTNLRLHDYNGLHLVYLAPARTRSIVYTHGYDAALVRDVEAAGAFYESWERLSHALVGYFQTDLPASDRRRLLKTDRRVSYRGGRRCSDVPDTAVVNGAIPHATASVSYSVAGVAGKLKNLDVSKERPSRQRQER